MRANERIIYCCNCQKDIKCDLVTGEKVYKNRRDLSAIFLWQCPNCKGFVGCHKAKNKPLGCIPTRELKKARQHIHKILDPLWVNGRTHRGDLYRMLTEKLGREYHTAELRTIEEAREIWREIKKIEKELPLSRYEIIENPKDYIGNKCHVVGWHAGAVFYLTGFENGFCILETPKTGKTLKTKNQITALSPTSYGYVSPSKGAKR